MEFRTAKCKVMGMGKSKMRPSGSHSMGRKLLQTTTGEKDLGVTMHGTLSPEKHINKITGAAYRLVTTIRTAFRYMEEEMIRKLIVSLTRPNVQYASVIWATHLKKQKNVGGDAKGCNKNGS